MHYGCVFAGCCFTGNEKGSGSLSQFFRCEVALFFGGGYERNSGNTEPTSSQPSLRAATSRAKQSAKLIIPSARGKQRRAVPAGQESSCSVLQRQIYNLHPSNLWAEGQSTRTLDRQE